MYINKKEAGILLHPTSLPSNYGIGDLGNEAYRFIDFLHEARLSIWQFLPLGPVGYGNSPYQSYSALAGNHMLISIDLLIKEGLIPKSSINYEEKIFLNNNKIHFQYVNQFKMALFRRAFESFDRSQKPADYYRFIDNNRLWLDDYALFMALKEHFGGLAWVQWEQSIVNRNKDSIHKYRKLLEKEIKFHMFLQFKFVSQWNVLKSYANKKQIKMFGDLPIFVSHDSSDCWSYPHLFDLDKYGNPNHVAGVPPDYFSETGQYWGNPLYKWNVMYKDNYKWWQERFKIMTQYIDIIRIDHFRGFEAFWQIPAHEKTAINGKWVLGPGENFFNIIEEQFKSLSIVVEDLGFITPEVHKLRDKFNYPGMQIIQFAFEGGLRDIDNALSTYNTAIYTGTHDNETILGWYKRNIQQNSKTVDCINYYCGVDKKMEDTEICWRFIELAFQSNAKYVIIPLQDILALDNTARMNLPGTVGDNWNWRFTKDALNDTVISKLYNLSKENISNKF